MATDGHPTGQRTAILASGCATSTLLMRRRISQSAPVALVIVKVHNSL
jgi:hypothetical protein